MMQEALVGAILNWAGISKGFLTGLLGMKERQASIHCSTACGANTGFKGRGTLKGVLVSRFTARRSSSTSLACRRKGRGTGVRIPPTSFQYISTGEVGFTRSDG